MGLHCSTYLWCRYRVFNSTLRGGGGGGEEGGRGGGGGGGGVGGGAGTVGVGE